LGSGGRHICTFPDEPVSTSKYPPIHFNRTASDSIKRALRANTILTLMVYYD
jgi:hypothetical protein